MFGVLLLAKYFVDVVTFEFDLGCGRAKGGAK
jgi:hypothetical protein